MIIYEMFRYYTGWQWIVCPCEKWVISEAWSVSLQLEFLWIPVR